jgi:hypothetical protein
MTGEQSRLTSGYDLASTEFLVLIGRIVIGWGRVERVVDVAVVSGRQLIPSHFKNGRPPRNLSPKMKAFRELVKSLPETITNSPWIDIRIDEFLVMSEVRHTIIHGFLHGVSGEEDPQIYFRRAPVLTGDAGHRVIVTRSELESFVTKLQKIEHDFMMLMGAVVTGMRLRRAAQI